MKQAISILCLLLCSVYTIAQQSTEVKEINQLVDAWHKAAADADFDAYFSKMTEDGVFIGTDAEENWSTEEFKVFCKPYFDAGKAWDFKALERHVFLSENGDYAWFDEVLDTWMKLCRGSGVLKKVNGEWKIAHYVLSFTIPNDNADAVIELKKEKDSITTKTRFKK